MSLPVHESDVVDAFNQDIVVQLVIGGRNKYLINGHVAQPR